MIIVCLGGAESAAAGSKENRAETKFYMDISYPLAEVYPFSGFSLSMGGYTLGGGIKFGGGVSSSEYASSTYFETRLFAGQTFNIPLKIKWNKINRDSLSNDFSDGGLISRTLKQDLDTALEQFSGDEYRSYSFGFANEWEFANDFIFSMEWIGYETSGGFLARYRLLQFSVGVGL